MGYSVIKYDLGAVLPKVTESTPGGVINSLILPECMQINPYDGTRYPCGTNSPKYSPPDTEYNFNELFYKLELWTETAHTAARDEPSRLVFLEDFTRRNIAAWLTKDGIGTAAYDLAPNLDLSVDSYLLTRCAEAIRNFNDIFQPDRWQVVPHSAMITCHTRNGGNEADHYLWVETWQEGTRPNPSVMNDALTRIFGKIIGAFIRDPWLEQAWEVIKRVPRYSGPCCGPHYDSAPYIGLSDGTVPMLWPWTSQPEAPSKYFWRIVNGKIEPTVWTKDFLDLFAPSKMGAVAKLSKVIAKKKKVQLKFKVPMLAAKPSGTSVAKIAVIGTGAVVGAGVLWWIFA